MPNAESRAVVEAVWRAESARIVAGLARLCRDVDLAEQAAHDAVVEALERWPADGIPANPAAWLTATARRRAIDALRRERVRRRHDARLGHADPEVDLQRGSGAASAIAAAAPVVPDPDAVPDDVLRLIFLCCHPVLPPESRSALSLRLLAGLSVAEIARAYLVPEATIAQRIVRAKRTLVEKQVPFEMPDSAHLAERLASVLEVVYLLFNEGYAATAGESWVRTDLCSEALRLGRMLAEQVPDAPEVHGLVALMEFQTSRFAARSGAAGDPVLLLEQDRTRWDGAAIERGLTALRRAEDLGGPNGRYRLEAAIAACHARARRAADTDWPRIVELYGELIALAPSPIAALNRAVAVAMAFGPSAGLYLVEALAADPALRTYHLLPSVRGALLQGLGRYREAQHELERAADMAHNLAERQLLRERAEDCARRAAASGG